MRSIESKLKARPKVGTTTCIECSSTIFEVSSKFDQPQTSIVDVAFERTSRSAQFPDGTERSLRKPENESRLEQKELRPDIGDEILEAGSQGAPLVELDLGQA